MYALVKEKNERERIIMPKPNWKTLREEKKKRRGKEDKRREEKRTKKEGKPVQTEKAGEVGKVEVQFPVMRRTTSNTPDYSAPV